MKIIVPKKILKRIIIAGIVILPLLMFLFPQWFPGILYPIKDFEIISVNPVDKPDIRDRELGKVYPEGFYIGFRHISSSQFTFKSVESYIGTKPRRKLYIKEIAWEWERGSGVFTRNFLHEFSETAWSHPENGWHCISWVTVGLVPDEIDFIKIFRKKKMGEVFPFQLVIRYHFDDEPETVQILDYQITARRGKYRPTYLFLF
jgi:hypothetical protein